MIYLNKSYRQMVLHRYLMSEKHFGISWAQRVTQQGEVMDIGYRIRRSPSHTSPNGSGRGMLHRMQQYARAGHVKRINIRKTKTKKRLPTKQHKETI